MRRKFAQRAAERACKTRDCNQRHYAKGFCKKHYTQVLRHGKLTPERERGVTRVCAAKDCGRTDTIHGYCRKHARQIRVHGHLTPEREHLMGFVGCTVPNCRGEHRARGLCAQHYNAGRLSKLPQGAKGSKRLGRAPRRIKAR